MENIKEEDQYLIPGFTLKQTISLQTLITASITEALEQRLGPANGFIQTQAPISGMQASTTAHEDNSGAGVANSTTAQIPPTAKNFKGEEEIKVKETSDERMTTSDISSLDQATKKALEKRKADKIDEPPAPAAKKSRSKSKTPTQSSKDNSLPNRLPNDRTIVPQFYSDAYHRLPANAALGRAHVVDIERYFSTEGSRPLKMADVIATILFRHQIKVLDAFLNVPRHLDFSFTRREQADSHHLDFSIERRNFTVQCGYLNKDNTVGRWETSYTYEMKPKGKWVPSLWTSKFHQREGRKAEIEVLANDFGRVLFQRKMWEMDECVHFEVTHTGV